MQERPFTTVRIMWAGSAISGLLALASLFSCAPTLQPNAIDTSGSVTTADLENLLNYRDSGVLAYWKMEEGSPGTVTGGEDLADGSGLGNHLKIQTGSCAFRQAGISGYAIQTTALTAATTTAVVTNKSSEFSYGAWIKWNGNTPGAAIPFLTNGNGTTNGFGFILNDGAANLPGNKVSVWVAGVSYNAITSAAATSLTSGTWTHFFVTRSGGTWSLFVNGALAGTGTTATPVTPTTHTAMGAFPGLMDEVMIFNSALTADEVNSLYLVQSGKYGV